MATKDRNEIFRYLHEKPAKDVGFSGDVITLSEADTVEKAVFTMAKNSIISCPVISDSGVCTSIVDMLDVVNYVISVAPNPLQLAADELQSLEISGRAMAFKAVGDISNASGRDPLTPIFAEDPSSAAIEVFAKGVHRAPLLDRDNKVVGALTQFDICKDLHDHLKEGSLKYFGAKTIKELGLGLRKPVTVDSTEPVLQALNAIKKENVSALAVVEDGKLVGNFSASDLTNLYKEKWPSFLKPIKEYLEEFSPKSLNPKTINQDVTFLTAVSGMVDANVHRLWVSDDNGRPLGLVSTTDIMIVIRDNPGYVVA